jgi:hypothetical protein
MVQQSVNSEFVMNLDLAFIDILNKLFNISSDLPCIVQPGVQFTGLVCAPNLGRE